MFIHVQRYEQRRLWELVPGPSTPINLIFETAEGSEYLLRRCLGPPGTPPSPTFETKVFGALR